MAHARRILFLFIKPDCVQGGLAPLLPISTDEDAPLVAWPTMNRASAAYLEGD